MCRSRFIRAEGRLDAHVHHAVKVKMIPVWGHLSVLKSSLCTWPFLCKQWTRAALACLGNWFHLFQLMPSIFVFPFLSVLSPSFSPSLASSLPPTNLRLSLLLLTAAEKHVPILPSNLRAGRMMGLVDCGTWRCLHCQPNNLWFITPEMSREWRKTQNRKSGMN